MGMQPDFSGNFSKKMIANKKITDTTEPENGREVMSLWYTIYQQY